MQNLNVVASIYVVAKILRRGQHPDHTKMLIIRNCALFSGGWSRINESEMKSATLPNMIAINLTKI